MELITFESDTYKSITDKIEHIASLVQGLAGEQKTDDCYLSVEASCEYIGFGRKWLLARLQNRDIEYFNMGKIKIKRSALDEYMKENSIPKTYTKTNKPQLRGLKR